MSDIDVTAVGGTPTDPPQWRLAIDLGTTYTSATIEHSGTTELLMIDGQPRIPSTIAVDDDGQLVAGISAERVLARAPERAERNPKRRIGDEFVVLGEHRVATVETLRTVFSLVGTEAGSRFGGAAPSELVITHPARWGAIRLGRLVEAATAAGLPEPILVPEPVAAVWAAAATAAIGQGETAAIYDLGGGTLDTAVVRRSGDGYDLIGPPGGSDRIGGEMFDERLYVYLGDQLADADPAAWEQLRFSSDRMWRRAAHEFRDQVRVAKEALSVRTEDTLYLGAPVDRELRLTRDELVTVLEADIAASIAELDSTISRAGLTPDEVDHVFLVGGGSRMPAVAQRVGDWLGSVPATWGDPKSVVAIGALAAAAVDGRRLAGILPTGAVAVTEATTTAATAAVSPEPQAVATTTDAPFWRRGRVVATALAVIVVVGGGAIWAAARSDGDRSFAGDSAGTTTTTTTTESAPAAAALDDAAATSDSDPSTTTTTSSPETTTTTTSMPPSTTSTTVAATTTSTIATGSAGGGTATTPAPTTPPATAAPTTAPPPTTTTTVPAATTTTTQVVLRTVPNVIGDDFSEGQQRVLSAGLDPVRDSVTCTGGEPPSQIIDYNPKDPQPPLTKITLTTCI